MPFFFMIAGFCFDESRYFRFRDYAVRKCRVLLYPYFMLTLAVAIIFSVFDVTSDRNWFAALFLTKIPGSMVTGFWFVRALFWVELLFGLLVFSRINSSLRVLLIVLGASLGFFWSGNLPFFEYTNLLVGLLFYQIGFGLRPVKRLICVDRRMCLALPVLLLCHVLLLGALGFPVSVFFGSLNPFVYLFTSFLGMLSLLIVSVSVEESLCGKALAWIGRYSILLLAIHPTIGICRQSWIARWPYLAGLPSFLVEVGLIVVLMALLSGPLSFFMRIPKNVSLLVRSLIHKQEVR